jgi:catalase-peroxidase
LGPVPVRVADPRTPPDYLTSLFKNDWTLVKSPAGALQFEALSSSRDYPDPFNKTFRRATMLVSDLALRDDPAYSVIAKKWSTDFQALTDAFAAAWCKSFLYTEPLHPGLMI